MRESDDDVFATASAFSVSVARRKDFCWDDVPLAYDAKPWMGSAHNVAIRKAANDFDMVIFYLMYALKSPTIPYCRLLSYRGESRDSEEG